MIPRDIVAVLDLKFDVLVLLKEVLDDKALLKVGVEIIFDHFCFTKLFPRHSWVISSEYDDERVGDSHDVHVFKVSS